ncbi:hypothetical protein BD626DRAFT_574057 [Schizophyllum amplum]|uniref:BTB domain-containing protein n=1 Tax=Schizophyllum amplum TaxID=97359 RepID=A0A550BZD1_9AGAR|nr:hypothetical protein BD626DRAFT_574057 [Auriculariopsis ampla]
MTHNENTQPRLATAPFDDEAADIILRSSDGVDFRVHKVLLSLVSSFFRDMFALPHVGRALSDDSDRGQDKEGRPVVEVEEDSANLEKLLRCCDPRCTPHALDSWDDVSAIMNLAIKYDAPCVSRHVGECLHGSSFVAETPLQVYALAVRIGNRKLAQMAAAEASRAGIANWEYCKELGNIPASAYHHLVAYHIARAQAAVKVLDGCTERSISWPDIASGAIHIYEYTAKFVLELAAALDKAVRQVDLQLEF